MIIILHSWHPPSTTAAIPCGTCPQWVTIYLTDRT